MNIATTLTTLAAIAAGSLGIDTQGQTAIKAVIAAVVGLVVAVHTLVTYLAHRNANNAAATIAQAHSSASTDTIKMVLTDLKEGVTAVMHAVGANVTTSQTPAPASSVTPAAPPAVAAAPAPVSYDANGPAS